MLVFVVALVLGAAVGRAWAGPTRKVSIDSQPRGASIYLGEKEAGAAGVTPLVLDLPVGETVIIVELDNYIPKFETITVPKGKGKPVKVMVQLEPGGGAIVVTSDGPLRGARILVDGQDEGTAPGRVDVPAGSHRVEVVTRSGKSLHSEEVEVTPGGEVAVALHAGKPDKVASKGGKGGEGGDAGGEKGEAKPGKGDGKVASKPKGANKVGREVPDDDGDEPPVDGGNRRKGKSDAPVDDGEAVGAGDDDEPRREVAMRDDELPDGERPVDAPRERREVGAADGESLRVHLSPLVEVGWRYFEYSDIDSIENTPALKQLGVVLIGARAEVVPLRALERLALVVHGGYAVPQDLTSSQGMLRAAVWRVDAAATYRFRLTSHANIVALAGYARQRYRFEGPAAAVALVPDATYSQVRLGVGLMGRMDWLELSALVENRPVLSGGRFANRFKTASADGLAASLSTIAHLGERYFARVDGSVVRYGWSFTFEPGDTYRAGGASDVMLGVTISAGAAF